MGLDGLRAVAILLVILWHCATWFPRHALGPLTSLADAGWAGVDLFFALSGFLITRLILGEERQSGGRFSLPHFYARRALRILPPYYLVLGLNLILIHFAPFQAAVGSRTGGALAFRIFGHSSAFAVQTLSHFRMDSILWGALGTLAFAELGRLGAWRRLSLGLFLGLVVTMFLTGFISTSPGRLEHAVGLSLLAICFSLLVVEVATSPDSLLTRMLETAPLRALGKVSYGMYLLHMQALSVATTHIALLEREASLPVFALLVVLTTIYTYLASFVMYRFYEVRFLVLKKRFGRMRPAAPLE